MNQNPSICKRLESIHSSLNEETRLVAVSKYHCVEKIEEAYQYNQRIFGESRVQELIPKYEYFKDKTDIEWHFIGSLQRNKVKYIAEFIELIHSVDSIKLIDEIERQASKYDRQIAVLLEVKVAQEDTKSGVTPQRVFEILRHINENPREYKHIIVRGLMAMASYTEYEERLKHEFMQMQSLFNEVKTSGLVDEQAFCELSMGMSSDYELAMQYGSTLVRIGSAIFGNREY